MMLILKTKFAELNIRRLDANGKESTEDIKIIRRIVERAVSMAIQSTTEKRMRHGIYMLEDPIALYRCERAQLYLGFSADIRVDTQQPYRQKAAANCRIKSTCLRSRKRA